VAVTQTTQGPAVTTRRAAVLAPLAAAFLSAVALPAAAPPPAAAATELKATATSGVDAFVAVMNGRDSLTAAMELQGMPEGGKRARIVNLLPRYSDKVQLMTVMLPTAVTAAYGDIAAALEAVSAAVEGGGGGGGGAGSVPEARLGQMEDILVGANNLLVLAAYVSESKPFEESDIPQETFARAVAAIDVLIRDGPEEMVRKASAERCRRLIASARDMAEMRDFASSSVCNNI